uniref:Neuropeptide FF receptor 1 n=1 Tax=Pan paniscus TaxID=9597 RepID=A0A2R9C4I7_PANPA
MEEGRPSQPPNSSWPLSQNGTNTEATPAANLTFSSYYQHTSPVAAMFIVAYALIFLLCMVGNTLVCFIVLKNRHMRTVTNMFILNLAVSDLLVGIFCMPTTLVDNLITGWPFDNATCKMSGLVQGMSVSASVFTLVAIAVERFRCIVHPFREKLTLRKALVTIAVIWALALLIMCPSAVTLTVTREEHHFMVDARNRSYPLYSCWEAWPEKGMRRVYTTVLFSHIYLAPLALIVVMYARIARKLCQAPGPEAADRRASRRRARVVHMLVMVALFFTLSWLPLWALLLLIDYGQLSASQLHLVTVYAFPFAHWLAFFNSSANPIIYGDCPFISGKARGLLTLSIPTQRASWRDSVSCPAIGHPHCGSPLMNGLLTLPRPGSTQQTNVSWRRMPGLDPTNHSLPSPVLRSLSWGLEDA